MSKTKFHTHTLHVRFRNKLVFYGEELLAPRPTPKLEDHLLSAVRDCLFNIFAATLHTWRVFPPSANLRTCHAVVTRDPPNMDGVILQYLMIYAAIYLLVHSLLCLYLPIYLRLVLFSVFHYYAIIKGAMVTGHLIKDPLVMKQHLLKSRTQMRRKDNR
jgi:hypothetical protein